MLRVSRSYFAVSSPWALCASQLQEWLSVGAANPKALVQARSFLKMTRIFDSVGDADDAIELVYYMHRVGYPRGSHLEVKAAAFLQDCTAGLTAAHVENLCRFVLEQPTAVDHWIRVAVGHAWFVDILPEVLQGSSSSQVFLVCDALALCRRCCPEEGGWTMALTSASAAAVRAVAQLLAPPRGAVPFDVLLASLRSASPIDDDAVLVDLQCTCFPSLTASEMLTVAQSLPSSCAHRDQLLVSLWGARPKAPGKGLPLVPFAEAVHTKSPKATDLVLVALSKRATNMDAADLPTVCRIAGRHGSHLVRRKLAEALAHRAGDAASVDTLASVLACSVALNEPGGAPAQYLHQLERALESPGAVLSPAAAALLVASLGSLRAFPAGVVQRCHEAMVQEAGAMSTAAVTQLLQAMAHIPSMRGGPEFRKLISRLVLPRKFERRLGGAAQHRPRGAAEPMDSESFTLLLTTLRPDDLDTESKRQLLTFSEECIAMVCDTMTLPQICAVLTAPVGADVISKPMERRLLAAVAAALPHAQLTIGDLGVLYDVIVAKQCRDTALLRSAGAQLVALGAPRAGILKFASAARKLKLLSVFREARLTETVASLEGWTAAEAAILLNSAGPEERGRLAGLPGAQALFTNLSAVPTWAVLILIQAAEDGRVRQACFAELAKRQSVGLDEIDPDDFAAVVARCESDTANLTAVCRICGAQIKVLDETHVGTIFAAVKGMKTLPTFFFRTFGVPLARLAPQLTTESALDWLLFYEKHQVRDDAVVKALFSRVRQRKVPFPPATEMAMERVAKFYGASVTRKKVKPKHTFIDYYEIHKSL